MDSQGDTNTHGSQNIATMPGVKSSSVVQVNGSSTVNSNECGTAGLEDSLAAVQLSYGSGHQSTDTGVDLNASLVGNCMGASGIVDQTNHGMEFGFGFPNSWVSPPMSGMHHGSSGYQLHQAPLLNPNSISSHPHSHGSLLMSPDQAAAVAAAAAGNSPVDSMSQPNSGDPGSTTSSVHGVPSLPAPPPPQVVNNHFGMGGMLASDPLESILGPFPCARLRGLPFEASIQDVLVFFHGLLVLDVVVSSRHDGSGRGVGEAFVIFSPVDFQIALQHNRQNMGRRYIEVFPAKRADYYSAICAQYHVPGNLNTATPAGDNPTHASSTVWTEKGPTQATVMMQHLHLNHQQHHPLHPTPYYPHQQQHHPINRHGGRHNHDGRFGRVSRGGRFNNYRSSQQLQWQNQGGATPVLNANQGSSNATTIEREHTGYLRMRGLPFAATKENVVEFFKDFPPDLDSIIFSYRADGRSTGEAYVQFTTAEEAKSAMQSLNRNMMGTRYIELFVSSKDEHRRMHNRSVAR